MFHQEFGSIAILRNYLDGRNPLVSLVSDVMALPADILAVLILAGSVVGVLIYFLGLLYTKRVVRVFDLPASILSSLRFSGCAAAGWGLSGAVVLIVGIPAWGAAHMVLLYFAVCGVLGVLAVVDWYTGLLPDELTLPLMWVGLIWAAWGHGVSLHQALGGVVVSYVFLVLIFQGYYRLRQREGMGQGDFKLTAALGAWVGLPAIAELLLLACMSGVFWAMARAGFRGVVSVFPFGPCLSVAGVLFLLSLPS